VLRTTDGGVQWTLLCPSSDPSACPSGAVLKSFHADALKPKAGAKSFFDVSKNIPNDPGTTFPLQLNIWNAIQFLPNFNPSRKEPWLFLSDATRGGVIFKVAEPQNALDGLVDRMGDQDPDGNPLPDGFVDLLLED